MDWTFRQETHKRKINEMSKVISILTPTRNRVSRLNDFILSVYQHTRKKGRVEMLMYVDDDDPSKQQYKEYSKHCQTEFRDMLNIHFVFGEAKSVSKSWNDLYAKSVGDILIMGNDDLVYRTSLWDLRIEKESERFEDEIYCMWMDDMINDDRHCAFPIVSRKWCETLGYFTPGVFEFGYNDTWVYDIAKRIGRCKWIGNVVAEHMHFSQSKSQTDDTYRRNRVGDRGNLYQLDGQTFASLEMVEKRMADAEKLRAVMK